MKYKIILILLVFSIVLQGQVQTFPVDTLGTGSTLESGATGLVTDHPDVFSSGSGSIITTPERNLWNTALQLSDVSDVPVDGSLVPITSNSVFNNLALKQNILATYDTAPISGSSNLVTSGGVFTAINSLSTGVTSFNTRTGTVVPIAGDYSSFYMPLVTALSGYNLALGTTAGTVLEGNADLTLDDLSDNSTTDLTEGINLYYTEARVSANASVVANTAKVSADGSVTTHSDVTNAGSGLIITGTERTTLGTALQPTDTLLAANYLATKYDLTQIPNTSDGYIGDVQTHQMGGILDGEGFHIQDITLLDMRATANGSLSWQFQPVGLNLDLSTSGKTYTFTPTTVNVNGSHIDNASTVNFDDPNGTSTNWSMRTELSGAAAYDNDMIFYNPATVNFSAIPRDGVIDLGNHLIDLDYFNANIANIANWSTIVATASPDLDFNSITDVLQVNYADIDGDGNTWSTNANGDYSFDFTGVGSLYGLDASGEPVEDKDLTNKAYVDGLIQSTVPTLIGNGASIDIGVNKSKNIVLTGLTATINRTGTINNGQEINVICANAAGCTLTWNVIAGAPKSGSVGLGSSVVFADGEVYTGALLNGNWQGSKY